LSAAFLYLGLLLSLSISILLLVLSLRVEKEEILPGYFWTYIQDPRYYGLAEILVHITVFILYLQFRKEQTKPVQWLFLILLLLLIPETMRGIIFDCKRIIHTGKEEAYWQRELGFQQYADQLIREKQDALQVKQVVVGGSSNYVNSRVSLYSRIPVLNETPSFVNISSLQTKENTLVLVILNDKAPEIPELLYPKGTELAGSYNGFYFYTCYVTAH